MSIASGPLSSVSQVHVGNISETVHNLLSERECSIFDKGLSAYHKRRDVNSFTEGLAIVLNTNRKRQLLVPIREAFVKPSDVIKFNTLAIRNGLAMPVGGTGKKKDRLFAGARKIDIKRDPSAEWGFDVRGGAEQGAGVYVSWVEFGSSAYKAGLQSGDQIHKANDTNFNAITHYDATQLLKNARKLRLWVTSHGQMASIQYATKMFMWVDAHGRPTAPPPEHYQPTQIGRGHNEANERKVSMVIREGLELGLSIRGGAEHGLGIYVSAVDRGSVADGCGVKLGDQILEVNGVSFLKIRHTEAAKVIRANRLVVLKLKGVGKIPLSKLASVGSATWHRSYSAPAPTNPVHIAHTLPRGKSSDRLKSDGIVATIPTPTYEPGSQVMLTKTSSPARGLMNNRAKTVLSASEMSTFDYYVSQYEQGHIVVEDFTMALLQLLNTNNKAQLIAEVRSIIRPQDLDRFNTMTISTEIAAQKAGQNPRYSLTAAGESEVPGETAPGAAISHSSTFVTSSNAMGELSSQKVREVREQTRRELEESLRRETEQKLKEQFEQEKQQLLMERTGQVEEELRQKYRAEREAMEKELKLAQDQEKSKLEEKIWQEAEQHIRKELEEDIRKESEKRFHQEYTDRLQQELRKYKRQTEAEKRQRGEADKRSPDLDIVQMEEEEMERIQMEKLRRHMETEQRTRGKQTAAGEGSQSMISEGGEWQEVELENHQKLENRLAREGEQRHEKEKAKFKEDRRMREEIERAREEAERQMYLQQEEEEKQPKTGEQQLKAEQEQRRRKEEQRLREAERKRREEQRQREQEEEERFRENDERVRLEEEWQQQEIERQKQERQNQERQKQERQKQERQRQEEEKQKREEQEKRDEEQKQLKRQQEQRSGAEYQEDPFPGVYTGLKGKIMTVKVTKVNRKLGIAVDGGSNTKQNAVVIRQITAEGCAGLTGIGLETGQQILTVNGKSLNGLKHKEAVIAIKNAFEGPINKVMEFVVLDPTASDD